MPDNPLGAGALGAGQVEGERQAAQSITLRVYIRKEVTMSNTGEVQAETSLKVILDVLDENDNAVDLSAATAMTMTFVKPSAETMEKESIAVEGVTGKMSVILDEEELVVIGTWYVQGRVTFQDGLEYPTSIQSFDVKANL